MARYGQVLKDRAVARLLPPESAALEVVSREVGVGCGTLQRWVDDALGQQFGQRRQRPALAPQIPEHGCDRGSPLDGSPITFLLTSAQPFTLRLVDVGFAGDRVQVVANGTHVLGTTALMQTDDSVFAASADDALAAPGVWRQGTWALAAGSCSFTGSATESPYGGASWALMMLGQATLAGKIMRRA